MLLIGSGLMIRTFQALRNVQPGFTHPEQVQLMRIVDSEEQVKEPERVMRMQNAMMDKLAAIPGVTSVAFASGAPLEGFNNDDFSMPKTRITRSGRFLPSAGSGSSRRVF